MHSNPRSNSNLHSTMEVQHHLQQRHYRGSAHCVSHLSTLQQWPHSSWFHQILRQRMHQIHFRNCSFGLQRKLRRGCMHSNLRSSSCQCHSTMEVQRHLQQRHYRGSAHCVSHLNTALGCQNNSLGHGMDLARSCQTCTCHPLNESKLYHLKQRMLNLGTGFCRLSAWTLQAPH